MLGQRMLSRIVASGGAMGVLGTARWNRTLCEESEYYGSYKSDRFGGGIGERDLDEGR